MSFSLGNILFLGMAVHMCDDRTREDKTEKLRAQASLGYKAGTCLKKPSAREVAQW